MAVSFEHSQLPRGAGPVATVCMTTPSTGGQAGAIKVYPGPLDRSMVGELIDEQRTLAGLRNVSSILLIDGIEELPDGRAAIRMELCARSLAELVEVRGRLPAPEVVGLAETMAGVLLDAHGAGIVHGGVTPMNVLFRLAGQPVLADFGLGLRQCFTRAPEAAAAYTAPEVLRGAEPTESADLYGLGAVLYFALTGGAPFSPRPGEPAGEVLLRALSGTPTALGPDLPSALSELVTTLLAKDPAERPGSAAQILDRLPELHTPVTSEPAPEPSDAWTAPPAGETSAPPAATQSTSLAPAAQPDPFSAPAQSPPASPPSPPVAPSTENSHGNPPQEPAPVRPGKAGKRSGKRWRTHPLLLAAPAVLAVLAVLLGVLGGGGSGGGTPENAAADGDNPPSTQHTDSDTGGAPGNDKRKDDASKDEPVARPSDTSENDERKTDKKNSKPPPSEPSAPPSVELEIHRVQDHGSKVDLSWRSSETLTYAVFVAEQGSDSASANYRGPGTKLTVPVKPDLKYCFQVQGTDGTNTFQSPPRGIRGATCRS